MALLFEKECYTIYIIPGVISGYFQGICPDLQYRWDFKEHRRGVN
jgi:hypothetical protein